MKMKIEIQTEKKYHGNQKIVEIDICNGNWKYWEDHMETDEKQSLTINNICKSHYLSMPVKDVYPFYDHEKAVNDLELIVTDAMVRTYDSLIDYLNHRINNSKEEYKKHGWTERTYEIILFDLSTKKFRDDIVGDVVYEHTGIHEVKISVVE